MFVFLLGIIIGIAIGLLFHAIRTREIRQAFEAALAQNETFGRGLIRADKTLTNLHAMAARMRHFNLDLGGSAPLPASAKHLGQHFVRETAPLNGVVESAGPPSGYGGPVVQRRRQ